MDSPAEADPQATAVDPASVRSLAVARLRRAASLPRSKNGRRPRDDGAGGVLPDDGISGDGAASPLPDPQGDELDRATSPSLVGHSQHLPPPSFNPALAFLASSQPLSRSMSVSSRSVTPNHLAPFPLPTLSDIQSRHLLQRSNSAVARMNAMSKLTGVPIPVLDASPLTSASSIVLPASLSKPIDDAEPESEIVAAPQASPRPRLRRSHTVGGAEGEERRSAVGRRMMMRLGTRVATPPVPAAAAIPDLLIIGRAMDRLLDGETEPSISPMYAAADPSRIDSPSLTPGGNGQEVLYPSSEELSDGDDDSIPMTGNTFGLPSGTASAFSSDMPLPGPPRAMTAQDPSSLPTQVPRSGSSHLHAHFLPGSELSPTSARLSNSSAFTQSTDSLTIGGTSTEHLTDSFEYAAHLRRTNSGRTVRTISPMPPPASEDAPPLPTSPLLPATVSPNIFDEISPPPERPEESSEELLAEPRPTHTRTGSEASSSSTAGASRSEMTTPSRPSTSSANFFDSPSSRSSPSIPILPPGDGRSGAARLGQGASTTSFPASIVAMEALGRTTSEWPAADRAADHSPRAGGSPFEDAETTPNLGQHEFSSLSASRERARPDAIDPADRITSGMSWEEVPPEVPSDHAYPKKTDSLSGKIERLTKGKFRNRSASTNSRSPVLVTEELPPAPMLSRVLSKSTSRSSGSSGERRRGSNAEATPLPASDSTTSQFATLSPGLAPFHSGAHSPGSVSPLPSPSPGDSRYNDSKLAPFPGMARLEQERNRKRGASLSSGSPGVDSPLSRQPSETGLSAGLPTSSSAFGGGDGTDSPAVAGQTYFDLPQRPPSPPTLHTKKSWLAKAFSTSGGSGREGSERRRPSLPVGVNSDDSIESRLTTGRGLTTSSSASSVASAGSSSMRKSPSTSSLIRSSPNAPFTALFQSPSSPSSLRSSAATTPSASPQPNTGRFDPSSSAHHTSPPRVSTVPEMSEDGGTPKRARLATLQAAQLTYGHHDQTPPPSSSRHGPTHTFPSTPDALGSPFGVDPFSPLQGSDYGQSEREDEEDYGGSDEVRTPPAGPAAPLFPPKTLAVLGRLDSLLSKGAGNPSRPSQLQDPPRKLLLSVPVLQVVNNNTVKDRFLFLFTDLLVIAKPILTGDEVPSLDCKFIVKSVVELHKLKLSGVKDEDNLTDAHKKQHPVVLNFIDMFSRDPTSAIEHLTERSNLQADNIASLLFKTPELDRAKLGEFLSARNNTQLLRGFVARFPFAGVRVDEALRVFLLSVRLPTEGLAAERLLNVFARQWHESNERVVSFLPEHAVRLVLAMMQLNDALNPTSSFGFAFANSSITASDFISAFREHDPSKLVADDLLEALYLSIRRERLSQALAPTEAHLERDIYLSPARIASRLTYKSPSETITITIPDPDPRLTIRMHGAGLKFDPPVLTFSQSSQAKFRVTGTSLGQKTILFSRAGGHGPLYPGLPLSRSFFIERAFMRAGHTFQIAFLRENGSATTKRKYLFSFDDPATRGLWAGTLQGRIDGCVLAQGQAQASAAAGGGSAGAVPASVKLKAEQVALQVLRDALVPPELEAAPGSSSSKKPTTAHGASTPSGAMSASTSTHLPRSSAPSSSNHPSSAAHPAPLVRSASSSVVYARRAGKAEHELDTQMERDRTKSRSQGGEGSRSKTGGATVVGAGGGQQQRSELERLAETPFFKAQTGREIALLAEQNSLIPMVLAFLQAGLPPGDAPPTGRTPLPPFSPSF